MTYSYIVVIVSQFYCIMKLLYLIPNLKFGPFYSIVKVFDRKYFSESLCYCVFQVMLAIPFKLDIFYIIIRYFQGYIFDYIISIQTKWITESSSPSKRIYIKYQRLSILLYILTPILSVKVLEDCKKNVLFPIFIPTIHVYFKQQQPLKFI